jgi:hypothetical protein
MSPRWIVAAALTSTLVFCAHQETRAQSTLEYGKQLGNLKKPKVPRGSTKNLGPGQRSRASEQIPEQSIPTTLSVEGGDAYLYTRQDKHSDAITKLEQGEKLTPLGQAFGSGEAWYMVKTQKGAVGWVQSSSVRGLTEGSQ